MGKHCFVPNCNSGYSSCREKVSIFGAPKDPDLLLLWSKAIARKDRVLTTKDNVCEKHFEPRLILRDWTIRINGILHSEPRGVPRLADNAVPTIFSTSMQYAPRKKEFLLSRKKRIKKCNPRKNNRKRKNEEEIVPISEELDVDVTERMSDGEDVEKDKKEIVTYTRTDSVNYKQNNSISSGLTFRDLLDPPINTISAKSQTSERIASVNTRRNILSYAQLHDAINTHIIRLPNSSWAAHEINQPTCNMIVFTNLVLINDYQFASTKMICFDKNLKVLVYLLDQRFADLKSIGVKDSPKNLKDIETIIKNVEERRLCGGIICGRRFTNVDKDKGKIDSCGIWRHNQCTILLDSKSEGSCCDICIM